MASLKPEIDKLKDDSRTLAEDYVKLFSIRQSERLARLLGVLFSFLILSLLLLIIILFSSFAMAFWLNKVLPGTYGGFLAVGGLYVFATLLLLRLVMKKTPLMANFFSRVLTAALGISHEGSSDLKGLRKNGDLLRQRIDSGQDTIKSDLKLLRYVIIESLLKEILGWFKGRKKESKTGEETKPGGKEQS